MLYSLGIFYGTVLDTTLQKRGGGGGFRGGVRGRAAEAKGQQKDFQTADILSDAAHCKRREMNAEDREEGTSERRGSDGKTVLYVEKWSRIYPNELVVRRYFFPSAVCKRIDTRGIKGIYYCHQDCPSSSGDVRMWGMAFFCGWAFDLMRMMYASLLETILHRRGGGGGTFRGGGGRGGTLDQKNPVEGDLKNPMHIEKWSKVYPGQLVVRRYFFPSAICKRIDTKLINGIYYRKQDDPSACDDVRIWGMAFFCGWAFDIKRGFRKNAGERGFYNVAVDVEGDERRTGFTTAQLEDLLTVLRYQCRKEVLVQEGFPWKGQEG